MRFHCILKMSHQSDLDVLPGITCPTSSSSSSVSPFSPPLICVQDATPKCQTTVPYYAVNLPTKLELLENENTIHRYEDLIFDNAKDALVLVKRFKDARFKVFQNYDAALHFTQESGYLPDIVSSPAGDAGNMNKINGESVGSNFLSIKEQDLAKLRKAIEAGNEALVAKFVDTNPKYLITTCETPTILFVAVRYNALHVCCKSNQYRILQLLLDKIADKAYINRLFNDSNEFTITNRRDHLYDLYLNTPDKVAHDTPMHIACKFAAIDCLAILLDNPFCAIDKLNKDNKRPVEVICDRKGDAKVKSRMQTLFENHCYLQIVTCPSDFDRLTLKTSHSSKPICDENDTETFKSVRALAGPMSKACAQEFFQRLNSPAGRSRPELAVRLTDPSKGLQRIARLQCKSKGIGWKEYWTFLNEYIDLATEEGLKKLEKHLQDQRKAIQMSMPTDGQDLIDRLFKLNLDDSSVSGNKDGQNSREEKKEACDEEEELFYTPDSSRYYTPTSLQEEDDKYYEKAEDTVEFYLSGLTISEEDFNAATALTNLDLTNYPLSQQWYDRVISQLSEQRYTSLCQFEASNRSFNSGYLSFEEPSANSPIKLKEIRSPIKSEYKM